MLQSFRDNLKGTVATIMVGLMIIPFALFGVDSLFVQSGSANEAASVNGEPITETELRQAIFLQKQQLLSRFGENAPANFLTDERLRQPVLDSLIQRRVVSQQAKDGGMAVSDKVIDQLILDAEQFQQDGKFDPRRYTQLLRSMGYTPASYKRMLEQDLLLTQHNSGFTVSGFVTESELQYTAELTQQTRSFYYITIPLADSEESVVVAADEIQTHYQDNSVHFVAPEQVAIEYLDVTPAQLAEGLEFTEQDLRQQYEKNISDFEAQIQRHAAHILLEVKEDGSEKAVAEDLLRRLNEGEDFTALVESHSDDISTKDVGGDLGFSGGDIFPVSFEAALAELKVGETSGVVETDAGLHIIKLLEEQGAKPPTFEQQKQQIAKRLKAAQGEELFVEMLEQLGDLSYNAESLSEVADELGLNVQTTSLFSRSGGAGIAANPQVLLAAFSEEVLDNGNSSELIELGEERVVVLRLIEHKPSHTQPLEQVNEQIRTLLKRNKAKEALAAQAEGLKTKLSAGEDVEQLAKDNNLAWQVSLNTKRMDPKANREMLAHVFTLSKQDLEADVKPLVSGLHLSNGDYVVVILTKIEVGRLESLSPSQQASLSRTLARSAAGHGYAAYEAFLIDAADIQVNQ